MFNFFNIKHLLTFLGNQATNEKYKEIKDKYRILTFSGPPKKKLGADEDLCSNDQHTPMATTFDAGNPSRLVWPIQASLHHSSMVLVSGAASHLLEKKDK